MMKLLVPLAIGASLISCDNHDKSGSGSVPEGPPRVTRLDRPSRATPSSRQRLQDELEQARQIEDPAARTRALAEVAGKALEAAPDVFTQAVVALPPGSPERFQWIHKGVADFLRRSPEEALAWADSLADPQAAALARGEVAAYLVESDPQRAFALLPQPGGGNGNPDPAEMIAIRRLTAKAPAEAAAWAINLPAGEARDEGLKTVVSQWVQADASAAVSWIASIPNPTIRGQEMRSAATQLQGQPPFIRDVTLQQLDPALRAEIESEIGRLEQERENSQPVE